MSTEPREAGPCWWAWACWCLVGGLVATLWVAVPRGWLVTDRFTFPKALLFHAAALTTVGCWLMGARRWRFDRVSLLAGGFVGLGVVSTLAAHNPWLAFGAVGVSLSGAGLFLSARALAAAGYRDVMLQGVVVAVGLLAVSMVLEAQGPLAGFSTMNRAPGGLLGHRNRAAHLLVLALPVVWLCVLHARSRARLGLLLVMGTMVSWALTLSRSRAAWLAVFVVVGMGVWGWWRGRRDASVTSGRSVLLLGALLVGVGVALGLPNVLEWRSSYGDTLRRIAEHDAGSGRGRLIQYANTLHMVGEAPVLGVGPGNWTVHYPRHATPDDPSYTVDALLPVEALPQADWVGLLAERGGLALLMLFAIAGGLWREAWRRARQDSDSRARQEALALMSVLAALTLLGGLDTVLLTPTATFLVAVSVGALTRMRGEAWVVTPGQGARVVARVCAVLVMGGLLAYVAVTGWGRQLAFARPQSETLLSRAARLDPGGYEARVFLGQWLTRVGRCEEALTHFREAGELLPHAEPPQRGASRCQRLLQAAETR
ncbi:O-antigen ligase family protein [Myxococcus faecalis]|uniref:O-antigen ligase family protein n=1 Tax=Myxococcus faecalis TaxID=3115646 RepID=UPI003CEAA65B